MKLLLFFLAGFAAGAVMSSWAYIVSLKATLKIYKTYVETRLQ